MATPVGFGDVVQALKICHWFQKNCFDPIRNASVLYHGFKDDVKHLSRQIEQFRDSFDVALSNLQSVNHSTVDSLRVDCDELVGDVIATLEDCRALLRAKAKFNGQRATALDNAFWHARTQPSVDELRNRLQSHSYKISLIIGPVQLRLSAGAVANTQEILRILRGGADSINEDQFPAIPDAVEEALKKALFRDCPVSISNLRQIPLRQGVDRLSFYSRKCAEGSSSWGVGEDTERRLNLLKAHWLYKTIHDSNEFLESHLHSVYRHALEQIRQDVETQYNFLRIEKWDDERFTALDEDAWAIWPIKEIPKPSVITDPMDFEEKVAEVQLYCPYRDHREELFIFRVNETTLRLVSVRSSNSTSVDRIQRHVDLDCDYMVPLYAVGPSSDNCHRININYGRRGGLVSYELTSRKDALHVQSAFTGYNVLPPCTNVSCSITYRGKSLLARSCQETAWGEAQVWHRPMHRTEITHPTSPTESNFNFSTDDSSNFTYTSRASRTFQSFNNEIVSILETEKGDELVISELPLPPMLVLLVQGDSQYTMWQMDITRVYLQKTKNPPQSKGKRRFRSTIQRSDNSKSFPMHKLAVAKEQLDLWNVRAIAVPPRSPSSPKSSKRDAKKDEPAVERLDGTSIVLDFDNEQQQDQFEYYFKQAAVQHAKRVEEFERGRHVALSQGDTPSRRTSYTVVAQPEDSVFGSAMSVVARRHSEGPPMRNPITSFLG